MRFNFCKISVFSGIGATRYFLVLEEGTGTMCAPIPGPTIIDPSRCTVGQARCSEIVVGKVEVLWVRWRLGRCIIGGEGENIIKPI